MSVTALTFLITATFLFVGFIIVSSFNFKKRFNKEYHLRSHFPYEFNYQGRYQDNIYGNLLYALFVACIIVFFVFFNSNFNNGYLIFALIAGGITLVSLTALVYIPIDQLRLHMTVAALALIFSLGLSFAIVLASYNKYKDSGSIPALISLIISVVVTLIFVILLLNPKLAHWAEMDKETKSDGTVVLVRPKWFVLAYSEWMMFFLYLISLASLIVETI